MSRVFALVLASKLVSLVLCQIGPQNWTTFPFSPPALPLAVRSPYLNVWLPQGNNPDAAFNRNNQIWDMSSAVQWYASVVVDDAEFRLLSPWATGERLANQTQVEFTATRTSFLMQAAGVQFNMSFLSPIEPKNFTLQSLPFAYVYISAESIDGQEHRVIMYSDIEGGLATGDGKQIIEWSANEDEEYVILSIGLQKQIQFLENNAHPQDATVYYSFKKIKDKVNSWTISGMNRSRGTIFSKGPNAILDNKADPNFGPQASGDDTVCFGMAVDWGNISSTPEPAVWALGVYRNPSIQYIMPDGSYQDRSPYFASYISNALDMPKFVLDDFPRAVAAAEAFDATIRADGESISLEYADLLVLSARQAMGSMDITIPHSKSGSWDTSDVKIFMKNIGSVGSDNGLSTSVNNVDLLYAMFPVFLYLNPDIGGLLLEPLLEYQNSNAYKLPYAARNIGLAYPSAIGDDLSDSPTYGIDETSGMIIMTLAFSLASGNGSLIAQYYNLLRNWAEFLSNNTLSAHGQASGDIAGGSDFTMANQTNLVLKGIIGIAAMAQIAEAAGQQDDMRRFNDTATSAMELWKNEAISPSHANFVFNAPDTSGLMYNLYADKLLHLGLVPDSVYDLLTSYYQAVGATMRYGIPINNSPSQNTTTNWMMFAAATSTSNTTRDLLVSHVHAYASNNLHSIPFSALYDPSTGLASSGNLRTGIASPAQGGIFALLALDSTSKTITVTGLKPASSSPGSRKQSVGIVVGPIVAGLITLCFIAGALLYVRRRRRIRKEESNRPRKSREDYITAPYMLSRSATSTHNRIGSSTRSKPGADIPSTGAITDDANRDLQGRDDASRRIGKGGVINFRDASDTRGATRQADEGQLARNNDRNMRTGVETLRQELDTLRRDVELIRRDRSDQEEAPPLYSD